MVTVTVTVMVTVKVMVSVTVMVMVRAAPGCKEKAKALPSQLCVTGKCG
jgi:hypothetical protein